MKKSVGKTNLWAEKLAQLPLNVDAETSWSQMEQLLAQHLPMAQPALTPKPSFKLKQFLVQLKYILPIVSSVILLVYFLTKSPQVVKEKKQRPKIQELKKNNTDSIPIDSNQLTIGELKIQTPITAHEQTIAQGATETPQTPTPIADTVSEQAAISLVLAELREEQAQVKAGLISERGVINLKQPDQKETQLWIGRSQTPNTELKVKRDKNQLGGSVKMSMPKSKKIKIEKAKTEIITARYSVEAQVGLNASHNDTSPYVGIMGNYALNKRFLLSTGMKLNIDRTLKGSYTHPSYNLSQPAPPLTTIDNRKFNTLEIPLKLSYKINQLINLKAGPFINFALKQRGGSKLGPVANLLDTIYHSKEINTTLANTTINKIHFGFATSLNMQYKQFGFEMGYTQQIKPYQVKTNFGNYKQYYNTFTIGLSYQLRSKQNVGKR